MANLHLDCGLVTPESDKEVVPPALSQRLSGLKMMAWLCSPVLTCRTPQSKLPRRGWEVCYECWEFLVSRRWAVAVALGLSGMWREGPEAGSGGTVEKT